MNFKSIESTVINAEPHEVIVYRTENHIRTPFSVSFFNYIFLKHGVQMLLSGYLLVLGHRVWSMHISSSFKCYCYVVLHRDNLARVTTPDRKMSAEHSA